VPGTRQRVLRGQDEGGFCCCVGETDTTGSGEDKILAWPVPYWGGRENVSGYVSCGAWKRRVREGVLKENDVGQSGDDPGVDKRARERL